MKKTLIYLIGICCGIVIGTLVANLAASSELLWWLAYGMDFGLTTPFVLDLSVIKLTFGITLNLNISVVIFTVVSVLVTRRLCRG
ncbi:MAG: DUF4321 domain-containing protein [Lachnospiraceae bacterium]|nr:DUF4321 domain-containing protein [Lachnospiraceae bacterium]